jgi:hypothetical protein
LEETKKYFRELFQKQNYFGKEYLAVKSEIAKQLYLLMQTNLQAPTITIVKHKEGSFYKDWWFSLNGVEGVQFLYYYNTETQEHRITQLKPHADKSNYFGVYIHDNFFGTHTERIMEALKNHPSIRLKLLLN